MKEGTGASKQKMDGVKLNELLLALHKKKKNKPATSINKY